MHPCPHCHKEFSSKEWTTALALFYSYCDVTSFDQSDGTGTYPCPGCQLWSSKEQITQIETLEALQKEGLRGKIAPAFTVDEKVPVFPKDTPIPIQEKGRIYHYPNGEMLVLENVVELIIQSSGTHRLRCANKKLWIVKEGWRAIEIAGEGWAL